MRLLSTPGRPPGVTDNVPYRRARRARRSPCRSSGIVSSRWESARLPLWTRPAAARGGRGRVRWFAQFLCATRCPSRHPDPAQPCGTARRRVFPYRLVRRPRRVYRHLPASPSAPAAPRVALSPGTKGSLPVPRDMSRHDPRSAAPGCSPGRRAFRALAALPAVVGMPLSARYRGHGVRCLCDASTALRCASQPRHLCPALWCCHLTRGSSSRQRRLRRQRECGAP